MYVSETSQVNGRFCSLALLKLVFGDYFEELKKKRKTYLRCLRKIEKEKLELNCSGVDEVFIDLMDYVDDDDEELEDDACVTVKAFNNAIADMVSIFKKELDKLIEVLCDHGYTVDNRDDISYKD